MQIKYLCFAVVALGCFIWSSCNKDVIYTGADTVLRFSQDTLRFDTVFTELGSATRTLKIYNDLDEDIEIASISLEKGAASFFALNVDGTPGKSADNIRINANDSIYIFAEVTIDPNMPLSASPFIEEEWLQFNVNGNDQQILLEAWGQNANYIPSRFSKSTLNYFSCELGEWTWDDPRPYVIYGGLIIDSCDLILPAGTDIYVHGGVAINDDIGGVYNDGLLLIGPNASIKARGTLDEPVTFSSDRLEESFDDIAGQWNGISLLPGSNTNEFEHTIIKHSIVGLRVDSSSFAKLTNCEIAHTAGSGLLGVHSGFEVKNCLFYDNGGNGIQMSYGGSYFIDFCSISNYNNQSAAIRMDNIFDASPFDDIPAVFNPLNTRIRNCIITGNDTDEISLADGLAGENPGWFIYQLENCIVRVDEILEPNQFPNFFDRCANCFQTENGDTLFINRDEYDYHLDTMSIAIDKAFGISGLEQDKDGITREPGKEDLGCYEFVK